MVANTVAVIVEEAVVVLVRANCTVPDVSS